MPKSPAILGLEAEARAIEEGHRAFVQPGGWVKVVSDTKPGVSYKVTFYGSATGLIYFQCTCPAGVNRPSRNIPCKHSSLAGRRLEREGLARWHNGEFWTADGPTEPVSDPFAGLPQGVKEHSAR